MAPVYGCLGWPFPQFMDVWDGPRGMARSLFMDVWGGPSGVARSSLFMDVWDGPHWVHLRQMHGLDRIMPYHNLGGTPLHGTSPPTLPDDQEVHSKLLQVAHVRLRRKAVNRGLASPGIRTLVREPHPK